MVSGFNCSGSKSSLGVDNEFEICGLSQPAHDLTRGTVTFSQRGGLDRFFPLHFTLLGLSVSHIKIGLMVLNYCV